MINFNNKIAKNLRKLNLNSTGL